MEYNFDNDKITTNDDLQKQYYESKDIKFNVIKWNILHLDIINFVTLIIINVSW